LAEVRLQDLQADPVGTLRRLYKQLDLAFTPPFEQRMLAYLHANRDYQPNAHASPTSLQKECLAQVLQPLVERGRHDDPVPPPLPLPDFNPSFRRRQLVGGLAGSLLASVFSFLLMRLLVSFIGIHSLGFAWPVAVVIGVGALYGASCQGSDTLGCWAL